MMPSRFVTLAAEALCGQAVRAEQMEAGLPEGMVRRAPLGVPPAADALDAWEHDLAVHVSASDRAQAIGYTQALSRHFGMALALEAGKWSCPRLGPYDGKVRDPQLLARLAREHGPRTGPISPSKLETYARCPFQYFLRYVLGVEELDKPSEDASIPPQEWGRVVHEFYRLLYAECLLGKRLGDLTDSRIEEVLKRAASALDRLGAAYASGRPAVWEAHKRIALIQLRGVLEEERRSCAGATPAYCEFAFGEDDASAFVFHAAPGLEVRLRGRADRIDRLEGDGVQVIDYKSGSRTRYSKDALKGGRQLQLPLYLLAACDLLGAEEGRARYLFVGVHPPVVGGTSGRAARGGAAHRGRDSGGGLFPPAPRRPPRNGVLPEHLRVSHCMPPGETQSGPDEGQRC